MRTVTAEHRKAAAPLNPRHPFNLWLRTPDGGRILDGAVLGSLHREELEELARDYGISHRTAAGAIAAALREGF